MQPNENPSRLPESFQDWVARRHSGERKKLLYTDPWHTPDVRVNDANDFLTRPVAKRLEKSVDRSERYWRNALDDEGYFDA